MTIESRANEIMETLKAFRREKYFKEETLQELFDLQTEMVNLTFNETYSDIGNLRLYDVERHLEQVNKELGHPADDELQFFHEGCNVITNAIKAEISGNRGEQKTMKTLEHLHGKNLILRNTELRSGDRHTEIDAIVITSRAVFIVEVKNTGKNIFIDEEGNYYRTGEFLRWDCSLGEKMNLREEMIRKALGRFGFDEVPVKSIVVFTNNRIEIQNKCSWLQTCFLSQLCHIIGGFQGRELYSEEDMNKISHAIDAVRYKEPYPFHYDMKQFKQNFSLLLARLEFSASENKEQDCVTANKDIPDTKADVEEVPNAEGASKRTVSANISERTGRRRIVSFFRTVANPSTIKSIGRTVAVASVMLVATAAFESFGKGGF